MPPKSNLSRIDWIKAAFSALTSGGPQAIRVEPIARALNVSKGSFYWHFKDLAALQQSMIEHWLELGTLQIISALDAKDNSPRDRLVQLMTIAASDQTGPYGGPMVESAIRDWARFDAKVQISVAEVDRQRVAYVYNLMLAAGARQKIALRNANILYATLVGQGQLAQQDQTDDDGLLLTVLDLLLANISEPH